MNSIKTRKKVKRDLLVMKVLAAGAIIAEMFVIVYGFIGAAFFDLSDGLSFLIVTQAIAIQILCAEFLEKEERWYAKD